ncbi:MAG: hypothetical protein AAGI30_01535 [Planctomycetota bacterium]
MSRPARNILLVKYDQLDFEDEAPPVLEPMGTARELRDSLGIFNIAADGDPAERHVLHGPGVIVQMPLVGDDDEVRQLLVTINDDTIAWAVIMRLCRELRWRMMQA